MRIAAFTGRCSCQRPDNLKFDKTPPRNLFGAYKLTRIQLNISVTNVLGRYIAILLIQTILMTILNLEDGNQEIVEKLSAGLRVYRKQFVAW